MTTRPPVSGGHRPRAQTLATPPSPRMPVTQRVRTAWRGAVRTLTGALWAPVSYQVRRLGHRLHHGVHRTMQQPGPGTVVLIFIVLTLLWVGFIIHFVLRE